MNLILQHWHSADLPPIANASRCNIGDYTDRIGADHWVLCGTPFHPALGPQAQKLCLISEQWDAYDDVVMLDADMFATPTCPNLFDVPGHGFHQEQAHKRVVAALPALTSADGPFYGGCLYKFSREERKALRAAIDLEELKRFDNAAGGWDEGMMHRLCLRAGLKPNYLSDRWCYGSYWPDPAQAFMIHVRPKPTGDKMKNLRTLQAAGILPP